MKGVLLLTCLYLLCRFSLPVSALNSLLVFGDSYLDTGNILKLVNFPLAPYGQTFPGNSTGRLSDGVVFTDIIAEYLQIRPGPTPFTSLSVGSPVPPSGVNFATGGAGIIAGSPLTNLAAQVNAFEALVKAGAISSAQLASSLVVLSVGGNDYIAALSNSTLLDAAFVSKFAPGILNGTETQLNRIFDLGATNFVMLNLPPAQCAPRATARLNGTCLPPQLVDLQFHNEGYKLIRQRLASAGANATLLDLFDASLYVINNPACFGLSSPSVLTPCCASPQQNGCGDFNKTTSEPLFTVCPDPSTSFFWDGLHPTQAGWKALSSLFFFANNFSIPGPHLCDSLRLPCPSPPSSQDSNVSAVTISGYCPAPFLEGGAAPAPSPSEGGSTVPSPAPTSKGLASATPAMLLLLLALFGHLFL